MLSSQAIRTTKEVQSDTSSDSDSDEDITSKILKNCASKSGAQDGEKSSCPQNAAASMQQAGARGGRRKYVRSNAVWSNVICEQQLTSGLSSVNGAQMKRQNQETEEPTECDYDCFADRDVETYFVPKRLRLKDGLQSSLSEDSGTRSPSKRKRHGQKATKALGDAGDAADSKFKRNVMPIATERLDENSEAKQAEATPLERELAEKISVLLKEAKRDLIERCVRVLGTESAMKVLEKTLRIESEGGMLVQDGSRRRTAGGVFLLLIRSADNFTREQKSMIFEVEERSSVVFDRRAKRRNQNRKRTPKDRRFGANSMETGEPHVHENQPTASQSVSDDSESDAELDKVKERQAAPACDADRDLEEGEIE